MTQELEQLLNAVLADGVITEKERRVLHDKARLEGISADEIDVIADGRLVQLQREHKTPPPINPPQQRSRTQNFGIVRKCPSCGSEIPAGWMRCESCGHAISGVGFNSSVQQLSDRVNDAIARNEREESIRKIIENFPVPSTKEDLLEFIFFTKSKSRGSFNDNENPLPAAYRKKYYECIDKAKFYFPNDPQFQTLYIEHETYKKQFWQNLNPKVRMVLIGVILWIVFYFFVMFFV